MHVTGQSTAKAASKLQSSGSSDPHWSTGSATPLHSFPVLLTVDAVVDVALTVLLVSVPVVTVLTDVSVPEVVEVLLVIVVTVVPVAVVPVMVVLVIVVAVEVGCSVGELVGAAVGNGGQPLHFSGQSAATTGDKLHRAIG